MGNYVRDFRGNQLGWLEEMPEGDENDLEAKISQAEEYIDRWSAEAEDLRGLANSADELVEELEEIRRNAERSLDSLEERLADAEANLPDECLYCDEPASEFGELCRDCNKNEERAAADGW
jgi:chromosome segregation ATPase